MAETIAHSMAPIMFGSLIVFLLLGYPVAFSLGACGLLFFFIGVELAPFSNGTITLSWPLLRSLPDRIYGGVMSNDVLLAIPFFTFMGLVLERSGMAEDLLDTIGQLFGTIRGGLAYAVIFVGALLAATTGVVAASVISMGLISLPIMLRYGYDRRLAAGVIAASGTLAQIIPPSLVLIVMADQLGADVGAMYEGAFVPGLILSALYAFYVFLITLIYPSAGPGLPVADILYKKENGKRGMPSLVLMVIASGLVGYYVISRTEIKGGADFVILIMSVAVTFAFIVALINYATSKLFNFRFLSPLAQQVTFVMVPPLALIFLVLGTIFIGVATPTEGGAMGAAGAMLLAFMKRYFDNDPSRFNWTIVRQASEATAKLSAFVIFILIGARIFSLTFYGVNGHLWVEEHMRNLPGGLYGFLIVINLAVFLLAFFLDFFELAFIVIPLIKPAAEAIFTTDPTALALAQSFNLLTPEDIKKSMIVWFGVMLGVNMQTSFMHPPFGFALFYLRSVAPKFAYKDKITGKEMEPVTTGQIYWGAVPFVVIQCIMVTLVMLTPSMVVNKKPERPAISDQKALDQLNNLAPPAMPQFDLPPPKF